MNPLDYILNTARKITAAGKNALADQNPLGIVKNTILGLPQAAKDIATGKVAPSTGSGLDIARDTILGLPRAAKEVLLPNRGFTDAQIKAAKPSIKQTVVAPVKVGAELASSIGGLLSGGKGIQSIAPIPAFAPLADAGDWISRFALPKNAEEARAMRLVDVAGFLPVGSLKATPKALETIAKSKNALEISDILMSQVKNLARADAEKLAQGFVHLDTVPEVSRALNKIDYTINGVKGASNLPAKVTDVHDVQEIRNSIQEGQNLLKKGTDTLGNPLTPEQRLSIRRSIVNSQEKIGEGVKLNQKYTVEDVTPAGYGPEPTPSVPEAEIKRVSDNLLKNNPGITQTDAEAMARDVIAGRKFNQPKAVEPTAISPVDRLIAEGKIRVVSRGGRDTYQYMKGNRWQTARDESSALDIVTLGHKAKEPVAPVQLPQVLDERKINLELKKEALANDPANNLSKYVIGRGEFAGQLPEVTGQPGGSRWSQFGDDIAKTNGFADSEAAREAYDALKKKKLEIKAEEKALNGDIKQHLSTISDAKSQVPETVVPKSMPDTGEARALEKVAQGSLGEDISGNGAIPPSLTKIIDNPQTPVKKKVGYLDYWRTPEVVLEKIGLAGPMKKIRAAREAIDKELPLNIEKITAWSKRVSKESNQRIFKYLDGQAIDLRPDEKQVAQEIKTWLKGWAKRLGLPEDKQITHYITHLFDDQLIKKEFDEDLAKIIEDRIPSSVYDPFLLKRLGAKGYKEDTWKALDAYVKRATRKVHMDPALSDLEEASNALETTQWDYVKNYADRINMRPTKLDTLIDNSIKQSKIGYRFGQRPVANISRTLRQTTFRGMIGANIGSALRNLSQGVNTYAKLGEKYTAIGYGKIFTHGLGELKDVGVLADNFVQDRALSSTKKAIEKLDKGLFIFFDTAEKINRGAAYYGAKAKGIAKGMTEGEAIEYAKRIVRDTQFQYGALDTPVTQALSSDTGKILSQFMTYPVKQTEFLAGMAKNKEYMGIARYVLGGLAFTYTIGQALGMKPSELIPWYDYVSGQRKFGAPPSLKLPVELVKAAVGTKDQYGQERDFADKTKDVTKTLWGIIPGGTQLKKTIEGAQMVKDGGSFDSAGRKQFEQGTSAASKIQSVLFGKYASQNARDYFEGDTLTKKAQEKIQPIYDQAQALKEAGKIDEAMSLVNSLSDPEYAVYKSIKQAKQTEATASEKKRLVPIYREVQALAAAGKIAEAKAIVDKLSDEEYRVYKLLKEADKKQKQLREVASGEATTTKAKPAYRTERELEDLQIAINNTVAKLTPAEIRKPSKMTIIGLAQKFWEALPFTDSATTKALKREVVGAYHYTPQAKAIVDTLDIKDISPIISAPFMKFPSADQAEKKYGGVTFSNGKIEVADLATSVVGHEVLHALFSRFQPDVDSFNEDWNSLVENNSTLRAIDRHLAKDDLYKDNDMYGWATERFAYLGEGVAENPSIIPPELRKYYSEVFDLASLEASDRKSRSVSPLDTISKPKKSK